MKDLRTIILAAGKGARLKSDIPKVLHNIGGEPMIDYILIIAKSLGSLKTNVILGHQSEKVKEHLPENIDIVIQNKLLGTADAVKSAAGNFRGYKGDVLILSGDTPLLKKDTIKELVRHHKKKDAVCTFLTAVVQDNFGYGRIIRGMNGAVMAIREENDASKYEKNIVEINVGAYCFKSEILYKFLNSIAVNKKKKEFYLTDIIEVLTGNGQKVETLETDDAKEGLGVNTQEDIAVCYDVIRHRILKDLMRQGVTIIDPQTTYINAKVKIGRDTVIRPFTFIEENVKIGSHCMIGPFARIRTGVKLGNKVTIGNFVEISRSQIGNETIMKHFGFLGDAVVGSHVNIGAGAVTANYDGVNKNKTRINDQAFIGSDSILVAPVKVGKKAVTGAGCVVTKGKIIPDGKVVVGVPAKIVTH